MYFISDMKTALLLCFALPLVAQQTILLPLDHPLDPAPPPEKIEERGPGGIVDRAISWSSAIPLFPKSERDSRHASHISSRRR